MIRKNGFTLIELMVVVAILGILGTMAIPNILNMVASYQLRSAASDFAYMLRRARNLAIKEHRNVTIQFDLQRSGCDTDGRYLFDVDNKKLILPAKGSLGLQYGSTVRFGFGAAKKGASTTAALPAAPLSYQNRRIQFNERGLCTSGYVYLANDSGDAFAVGTNSVGGIMFKRWKGRDWKQE